ALGDVDEAERFVSKALVLLEQSPREQGGAIGALAITRVLRGDTAGAEPLFARAANLLEESNEFGEAARVCRTWATMLRDQDRLDEAAKMLDRAAELEKRARPRSLQTSS
ncbi:MAG: hypothetical protein ABSC36_05625, partial [Gaiellaceae bacterium]